jgi:endogenous inhibitor of DNA gyrase (YacG/DUF329 family)
MVDLQGWFDEHYRIASPLDPDALDEIANGSAPEDPDPPGS